MQILVIGATGYIGSAVACRLRAAGHDVTGLARSAAAADALRNAGIPPVSGDLANVAGVCDLARRMDAIVVCSLIKYADEEQTIGPIVNTVCGPDKVFVFTSGTAVLSLPSPDGSWIEKSFAEDESFTPPAMLAARVRTENLIRSASASGMRTAVIRPPLVWGNGGSKQIPAIFESVERTGSACYVGSGLNAYSHVHVDDLANLYSLVVEAGRPGAVYHAVAGEENFKALAEAVAKVKGCGTRSVTAAEALEIWGDRAERYFMVCSRSRSDRTRRELGWMPARFDVLDDIVNGSYRKAYA